MPSASCSATRQTPTVTGSAPPSAPTWLAAAAQPVSTIGSSSSWCWNPATGQEWSYFSYLNGFRTASQAEVGEGVGSNK